MLAVMLCVVQFSSAQQKSPVEQKIADQSTIRIGDLGVYKVVESNSTSSPYNYQSVPQVSNEIAVQSPQVEVIESVDETPAPETQINQRSRTNGFMFANPDQELTYVNNETKQVTVTPAGLDNFTHEFISWMNESPGNFELLSATQKNLYQAGNLKALYLNYISLAVKLSNSPQSK